MAAFQVLSYDKYNAQRWSYAQCRSEWLVIFSSPESIHVATVLTLKLLWLCIQTEKGFRHPHNTYTEDKINRQSGQLNSVICVLISEIAILNLIKTSLGALLVTQ